MKPSQDHRQLFKTVSVSNYISPFWLVSITPFTSIHVFYDMNVSHCVGTDVLENANAGMSQKSTLGHEETVIVWLLQGLSGW